MENTIIIETVADNIQIVKFNKPLRKNALDAEMYLRVTKILNDASEDDNVAMTVLTGTGDFYSSGNDLTAGLISSEKYDKKTILKDFINAFVKFPKMLIAVVNGPAVGIAVTTLALCDLVFAAENAFFYTPFTKLGILAEGCSTFTFPRMIGSRKAAEMLLLNHKMTSQEALNCGFVNYLFKPEEIQSKVWDKIHEVASLPRQSVLATKRLMRSQVLGDLIKTNDRELDELEKLWYSEEFLNSLIEFSKSKSKM